LFLRKFPSFPRAVDLTAPIPAAPTGTRKSSVSSRGIPAMCPSATTPRSASLPDEEPDEEQRGEHRGDRADPPILETRAEHAGRELADG
jgi:hypothetical protein